MPLTKQARKFLAEARNLPVALLGPKPQNWAVMSLYQLKHIALSILVCALLQLSVFGVNPPTQDSLTLGWNPSPAPGVVGYRVYEGEMSQNYSQVLDVGNATTARVSGLMTGVTYYFAVTAYDANGLESPFSGEISYEVTSSPATPPGPQLQVSAGKQALLSGTAPAGYQFDVLASTNLRDWTAIGNISVDASGAFQFTDPDSATNPARFYRLQQTAP